VDPNGDVRLCCDAWNDAGRMGNIVRESFRDIWNNERYTSFRKGMLARKPPYARCLACPAMGYSATDRRTHFAEDVAGMQRKDFDAE
jgi:radical SAM protein with 4Fe4S-binding SPASM domain